MIFFAARTFTRMLDVGRGATAWVRGRLDLTPQERANAYVSWAPPAVITASLGGHPYR